MSSGRLMYLDFYTGRNIEAKIYALIKRGCDVNVRDEMGYTPLLLLDYSEPKLLNALLAAGADVNMANPEGQTALHLAVIAKNLESVKLVLKAGADINKVDMHGNSPLMIAVDYLETNIVTELIYGEVKPTRNNSEDRLLNLSIRNCQMDVAHQDRFVTQEENGVDLRAHSAL